MLQSYNSFSVISSNEHQWITITLMYEKKTKDTPKPLSLLGDLLKVLKDIESQVLKK